MQLLRVISVAAVCAALSACSSGGINGRVTVAGGSASGIAVFAYGPTSGAAVTGSDGAFTLTGLDDGDYVLRAAVSGTDEGEQSAAVTVKGGKPSGDVTLAFHFSSGTLTGHVTFSDGSDATGLSVIASGPETKSATTEAGGAFTLSNLKSGAYIVSVEAPNTREGRVSIGAVASGSVDVGELRLTPVGRLTGTVTYNATAAAGVAVTVPGTSVSSVTDATGAFELINVPTGARTVLARTGESPFWRSASADVTVARGDNAAVDLALSDDAPKTGTVNGVVTFFTFNDPANITVTAEGSGVSAPVGPSGAFSLSVPVGSWDIVATAPSHPRLVLDHVVVHDGETITLTGRRLSWYQKVWTIDGIITSVGSPGATQATTSLSLLTVETMTPSPVTRLALLDVESGDLRFLSTGGFGSATLSSNGKYAAWNVGSAIYLYTVATGAMTTFWSLNDVNGLAISEDETTLFAPDSSNGLVRIPISTPAAMQRFPADGGAGNVFRVENGRWYSFATGSFPDLVTQVTTTTARTVFGMPIGYTPLFASYFDDGGTSALTAVPPDGGAPVLVGEWASPNTFSLRGGSASVPCFTTNVAPREGLCVKMADGSKVALPDDINGFATNEPRTRIAFSTAPGDGGVRGFYESALPPTAPVPAIDTSTVGWNLGWMTPTRVVAVEAGQADARKLRFVTNGTAAAVDTDTADGGAYILGPEVLTGQKSTGNWRMAVGDAPFRSIPLPIGVLPSNYAARTGSPVTKYGAIGFGGPQQPVFVVDENAVMVRSLGAGYATSAFRSGSAELMYGIHTGFSASYLPYDFQHQMWIDYQDDVVTSSLINVGNAAVRTGYVSISADGHSLMLGTYSNQ